MADSGKHPLVSVIMATHNRAELLPAAVDSVLGQSYDAVELILIDDGSEDATPDVLRQYADHPRVRLAPNPGNIGLQASLDKGVRLAQGVYLARIDDDDRWVDPDKLARQVAYLQDHPECGLLGTAYLDEQGQAAQNPLDDAAIRGQMLFRCPFCHSSVLLRASACREAGGYDISLPYAEDWELWMRMGQVAGLANLPDVMVARQRGPGTLSEQFFLRQQNIARSLVARHGKSYPRHTLARLYHALSGGFFRWFPVGGRAHRAMSRAFARVFGLQR